MMLADGRYPPRASCYLAQQAAEKALKAVLIGARTQFAFTHDLEALRERLPDRSAARHITVDLDRLIQWVRESRYPHDGPEANVADAQVAVAAARTVVEAARHDLGV